MNKILAKSSQYGEISQSQTIDVNKEPEELIKLGDELHDSDPSNAFKAYKMCWNESVLKKVGRLQKGSDKTINVFSDAAFLNLQICDEKAKENIDDIEDEHQQYCLGIVAQK